MVGSTAGGGASGREPGSAATTIKQFCERVNVKIKTEYQGATVTARYLTIHFRLEVGGTIVRASQVKIAIDQLPFDEMEQAMDRLVRRKLLEAWSDEPLPPWDE